MKRLLAIDFGTTFAWAANDGEEISFEHRCVKPPRKLDTPGARVAAYFDTIAELIPTRDVVYYEDVRGHKSKISAQWWAAWWALTLLVAERNDVPVVGVHTGRLKKWSTGRGNADKEQMIAAARRMTDWSIEFTEDEADAVCLLCLGMEKESL